MADILSAKNIDYSIAELNRTYCDLLKLPKDDMYPNPDLEAARFITTGYNSRTNERARVETYRYALSDNAVVPKPRRDYDSLLGFTDDIAVKDALEVYPLPNKRDQLERSLGILVKFVGCNSDGPARTSWLDPGCVPHVTIGKFGQHHMVRVFFPGLYHERSQDANYNTTLTEDELAALYDYGVRPAVAEITPHLVHDWPASYQAEVFRSRGQGLGFKNSTKTIPASKVYKFGEELRRNMAKISWGRHMVFQTQIRGVKLGHDHECNLDSARVSLRLLLRSVNVNSGLWWIDVGLEYLEIGRAMIWRSDSHHHLVAAALEMPIHEALSLTTSSKIRIDRSSHLTALAGFSLKIKTPQLGGKYQAAKIQAYTTDKQVTYNPERGFFGKFITPRMAMSGFPPTFCSSLLATYKDASKNVNVAARIEVRVPIRHALRVLMTLPDEVVRITLVSMKRAIWWNFRINRLHGCTLLLAAMNQMSNRIRYEDATLQTYAGICWLINGLHSRPQDDRTGRTVAKWSVPLTPNLIDGEHLNLGPHTLTAEDSLDGVPATPGGLVWLRHILIPPESDRIAFAIAREMDPVVFTRYFEVPKEKFVPKPSGQRGRPKKRTNCTPDPPTEQDAASSQPLDLGSAHVNSNTPPIAIHETNPQTHPEPTSGPDTSPLNQTVIDSHADRFFNGYLTEILVSIGEPRKNQRVGNCILAMEDRKKVALSDYQTPAIGRMFSGVQWQRAADDGWAAAFDSLFPHKYFHFTANTVYHYGKLPYRQDWLLLIQSLEDEDVDQLRAAVRKRFDQLAWVPAVGKDRIWIYKRNLSFNCLPDGAQAPVRILWSRWRSDQPTLQLTDSQLSNLRQEEEEDSEEEREGHEDRTQAFENPQSNNFTGIDDYPNSDSAVSVEDVADNNPFVPELHTEPWDPAKLDDFNTSRPRTPSISSEASSFHSLQLLEEINEESLRRQITLDVLPGFDICDVLNQDFNENDFVFQTTLLDPYDEEELRQKITLKPDLAFELNLDFESSIPISELALPDRRVSADEDDVDLEYLDDAGYSSFDEMDRSSLPPDDDQALTDFSSEAGDIYDAGRDEEGDSSGIEDMYA